MPHAKAGFARILQAPLLLHIKGLGFLCCRHFYAWLASISDIAALEFPTMNKMIALTLLALVISGCAGKTSYRTSCGNHLDAAWRELDIAKAEGFAGTVSYSKALSLLTGAKTQQQFEAFEGCTSKAEKARFYIRESRAGR